MRLNWAVYEAVYRAVDQDVEEGVCRGVELDRAMFWAVFDAMRGDPSHPSLNDFLAAGDKVAA